MSTIRIRQTEPILPDSGYVRYNQETEEWVPVTKKQISEYLKKGNTIWMNPLREEVKKNRTQ